jgi:hypothetical protein
MAEREINAATISGLVDYFGGYENLALILNVSVDDLRRWSEGKARPPAHIFFRFMDVKSGG